MFRVAKSPAELKAFNTGWNIGWFLFTSVYLPETLTFYGNWRRSRDTQRIKAQPFSTLPDNAKFATGKDNNSNGEVKRKKSGLYTKTGDKGMSSLYNGERRSKNDRIFHTLGHQDELNAAIGVASEYCMLSNNGLQPMLSEIQSRLFDLGAAVATPVHSSSEAKVAYTKFSPKFTARLEEWIDDLDAKLPPLTNFVIPSGGLSATHLNLARTICRRAERSVVPLVEDDLVDGEVGRYLNRLSDLLFADQRTASMRENKEEFLWIKAPADDA
eukprot:gene28513-32203_t